jgi:hypothetical protein
MQMQISWKDKTLSDGTTALSLLLIAVFLLMLSSIKVVETRHEPSTLPIADDIGVIAEREAIRVVTVESPNEYAGIAFGLSVLSGTSSLWFFTRLLLRLFPETQEEKRAKAVNAIANHLIDEHFGEENAHSDLFLPLQTYAAELPEFPRDVIATKWVEMAIKKGDFWRLQENIPAELMKNLDEAIAHPVTPSIPLSIPEPAVQPPALVAPLATPESGRTPLVQPISPSPLALAAPHATNSPGDAWKADMGKKIANHFNSYLLKDGEKIRFTGEIIESPLGWRLLYKIGPGFSKPPDCFNLEALRTQFSSRNVPVSNVSTGFTNNEGDYCFYVDLIRSETVKTNLLSVIPAPERAERANTIVSIGQFVDGTEFRYDFAQDGFNALYVIGSPGSGKTVLLQGIIYSIAARNLPAQFQIAIFDFKGMLYFNKSFGWFPWLRWPVQNVQSSPESAINVIGEIEEEMETRSSILGDAGGINIKQYNEANPESPIPYFLVVIDEYNTSREDLKIAPGFDVEPFLVKLIRAGRSLGMYLVLGGQDYNSKDMENQAMRRHPRKIVLQMNSVAGSVQSIGSPIAKDLLGNGHGIYEGCGLHHFQAYYSDPEFLKTLGIEVPLFNQKSK